MLAIVSGFAGFRAVGSLALLVSAMAELRRRRAGRADPRSEAEEDNPRQRIHWRRRRTTQDDLDGRDLRETDLHRARMRGLDLAGRDLSGADLASAHLEGTVLTDARLERCDLSWASLRGCDLRGAVLTRAQLLEVDLRDALLHGADLASTSGLETVQWRGARADRSTRWPGGFDARAAGVVIERSSGR
jgi:uncharacterized protein YjbI with pentapeptide repeats